MNREDHYREGERLLSDASHVDAYGNPVTRDGRLMQPDEHAALIGRARAHFAAALAEAAISWVSIVDDPTLPHPGEYVAPVRGVPAEPVPLEQYRPPTPIRKAPARPEKAAEAHDPNTRKDIES